MSKMQRLFAEIPAEKLEQVQTRSGILNPHSMSERERQQFIADSANQEAGNLGGYDCPKCLNRGYYHRVDENGKICTEDCSCMEIRKNKRIMEKSGLADMVTRYTFDNWKEREQWHRKAAEMAHKYAQERRGWFVMAGTVGAGKTHLCTALCGELMDNGVPVRYVLWRDLVTRAKAVVNDDAEYQRIVTPLKKVKCLYIDDMFKTGKGEAPTVGDVNLAFEIINHRYNDVGKMTIISSERTVEQILGIDEAVGSRIYERSKEFYLPLHGKKNWRLEV